MAGIDQVNRSLISSMVINLPCMPNQAKTSPLTDPEVAHSAAENNMTIFIQRQNILLLT